MDRVRIAELAADAERRAVLATSELVERLALAGPFEPGCFAAEGHFADVERLLCEPAGHPGDESGALLLREETRIAALTRMLTRGGRAELARVRRTVRNLIMTPTQHALDAFVFDRPWPLDERDESDLVASLEVWRWLTEAIAVARQSNRYDVVPNRTEIVNRLAAIELTRAFGKLLAGGFVGRRAELGRLRDFCLARPSHSDVAERPMVVYGVGGVGKSTLIARFVMDLAEQRRTAWAYLDLDRPTLSSYEPRVLVGDIIRQLRAQLPQAQWPADTGVTLREIAGAIGLGLERAGVVRFVVVVDTFEEAERHGPRVCEGLADLVTALIERIPRVKVIVAGRAPARTFARDDRPDRQLALAPFGGDEAVELLRHLARREAMLAGVPEAPIDDDLAREVVQLVDGIPLTLRLAARVLVREIPFSGAEARQHALGRVRAEFVRGFLYQRVLDHLTGTDPALGDVLRQVARASLVLRRVTPELVESVLLPSLRPRVTVSAAELYRELASEVALADEAEGVLRLRPEVRGPALAALSFDDPELVRRVHVAAAGHYRAQRGPIARAELVYHRLMAGDSLPAVRHLLDESVLAGLAQSIADLPDAAAEAVRHLRERDAVYAAEFDRVDWEEQVQPRIEEALRHGNLVQARRLLDERPGRTETSPLYRLESRIAEAEGDREAALRAAQLERLAAHEAADPARFADAVLRVAELLELAWREPAGAMRVMREAELEQLLADSPDLRLQLLLTTMIVGERNQALADDERWPLELAARALLGRVDPEPTAISLVPTLLLAAALGGDEPGRLREAASTLGVDRAGDPARLRRLREAIVRWGVTSEPVPTGFAAGPYLKRLWSRAEPPAEVLAALRDMYLHWGSHFKEAPAPAGALERQLSIAYPGGTELARLCDRAGLRVRSGSVSELLAALTPGEMTDLMLAVLRDSSAASIHSAIHELLTADTGAVRHVVTVRLLTARAGRLRVSVSLASEEPVTSKFSFRLTWEDAERIRWFFEDRPEYPSARDSAEIERVLERLGRKLFTGIFGAPRAAAVWAAIEDRLPVTRIRISARSGLPVVPWELLCHPRTGRRLALEAASFMRASGGRAAQAPTADGQVLRMLLVISRPSRMGKATVRSVAARFARLGDDAAAVAVTVLRPGTSVALERALDAAHRQGNPYHVVHIEGHDRFLTLEDRELDAAGLGRLLARTGVRVLVLTTGTPAREPVPVPVLATGRMECRRVAAADSVALEVGAAGVPGVLMVPYNVDEDAGARFLSDVCTALLTGQTLGEATAIGRRLLASWPVPVAYEHNPLRLFPPRAGPADLDVAEAGRPDYGLPPPPESGFVGRDDALLALDRAFDDHRVVLLHGPGGIGKTTLAVEFARWYAATGGLSGGPVRYSSLDGAESRSRLLDDLTGRPLPALWIWDAVEDVRDLDGFLRRVTGRGGRVLLVSRDAQLPWLATSAHCVELQPMSMRESVRLAEALAARADHRLDEAQDWRIPLRVAGGLPLAVTFLSSRVQQQGLHSRPEIEQFTERIRNVDANLLASFIGTAFSPQDRERLSALSVFRRTVNVEMLLLMGNPANRDAVPRLAEVSRGEWIELLDRIARLGALTERGAGRYDLHPAAAYTLAEPALDGLAEAYLVAVAVLAVRLTTEHAISPEVLTAELQAEHGNLTHALELARDRRRWDEAMICLQALHRSHMLTGRLQELREHVERLADDLTDPGTEEPKPGMEALWATLTSLRVQVAIDLDDWDFAEMLQRGYLAHVPSEELPAAILYLANILRAQQNRECVDHYQKAITLFRDAGFRRGEWIATGSLALFHREAGELAGAEELLHEAIDLAEADEDHTGLSWLLRQLSAVALQQFEPSEPRHLELALAAAQRALHELPAEAADERAEAHMQLAVVAYTFGDQREALRQTHQAAALFDKVRNVPGSGRARANLALLLEESGRHDEALRYFRAALHDFEAVGNRAGADLIESLIRDRT